MNGAVWAAHCIGRGGRGIRHRHEIGHLDACSDKQRIFDMSDSSEATINQDHPPWFQISDASDCRPANAALTVSPFFPLGPGVLSYHLSRAVQFMQPPWEKVQARHGVNGYKVEL